MVENKQKQKDSPLRIFLTCLIVFMLLNAGSHLSLLARHDLAVADFYLPTALSIVLIQWVGPKYVLPIVFLNAVFTSHLWGTPVEQWRLWFLFAIPESLFAFISWFLFRAWYQGKYWLPDVNNTSIFLAAGVMIPAVLETFLLQSMMIWSGSQSSTTFWSYVTSNLLSEFTSCLCITLPSLYYLTPYVQRKGWLYQIHPLINKARKLPRQELIELAVIYVGLFALAFFIEFTAFWYVYGLFALLVAIRYGFGPAIVTNFYILLISYVLPKFFLPLGKNDVGDVNDVSNIFLGANFLFVFAAITGRVISDVKRAEYRLIKQNKALALVNEELDRFVYSVSHDLSAPLKSILGLINVSRIDNDPLANQNYLDWIEKSVRKLEDFISEILDYSRNSRQNISVEKIQLKKLCDDILDNLQFTAGFKKIRFRFELHLTEVWQDKTRLKMILNNLLSNAVNFQKTIEGHEPYIKIDAKKYADGAVIRIEDNGEGIKPEHQHKIFEMFYRGSEKSNGSGLGLYIAREAASKIHGSITIKSKYGHGTVAELKLKSLT
jgi:signal transduction histidine kinase